MNFSEVYKRVPKRLTILILACILTFSFSTDATFAQFVPATGTSSTGKAKVTLPDPLTPEAVRGLVSKLSDQQVRELLLERLDAVARGEAETKSSGSTGSSVSSRFGANSFRAPPTLRGSGMIVASPALLEIQKRFGDGTAGRERRKKRGARAAA